VLQRPGENSMIIKDGRFFSREVRGFRQQPDALPRARAAESGSARLLLRVLAGKRDRRLESAFLRRSVRCEPLPAFRRGGRRPKQPRATNQVDRARVLEVRIHLPPAGSHVRTAPRRSGATDRQFLHPTLEESRNMARAPTPQGLLHVCNGRRPVPRGPAAHDERMLPSVPRIRDQRIDRAHDDLVGQVHPKRRPFLL
jgi:hypothetical protein